MIKIENDHPLLSNTAFTLSAHRPVTAANPANEWNFKAKIANYFAIYMSENVSWMNGWSENSTGEEICCLIEAECIFLNSIGIILSKSVFRSYGHRALPLACDDAGDAAESNRVVDIKVNMIVDNSDAPSAKEIRWGLEQNSLVYTIVHNDLKLNPPLGVLLAAHEDKKYLNTTYDSFK